MTTIEKLVLRLGLSADEAKRDDALLKELVSAAESEIMNRSFPFGYTDDTDFPEQYAHLIVPIAMDLYNHMGAEGQISHNENSIQRTYESSWISESLLAQVVPRVGVCK